MGILSGSGLENPDILNPLKKSKLIPLADRVIFFNDRHRSLFMHFRTSPGIN